MAGSKLTALVDLAGGQVSTDLAYVVDVSAGVNGSKKSTLNDLFEQITKNITDAVVKGIQGSGTNGAGSDLGLSGGKGTGTGIPGGVVVRYPLIGASGSTPQSLSANAYPVVTSLFSNTATTTVTNTTTETSIFSGMPVSGGSTRDIEAGSSRAGTVYKVKVIGNLNVTGTPTLQIKVKLNSTLIADLGAVTIANNATGRFWLEFDVHVHSIGATGSVVTFPHMQYSTTGSGALTVNDIGAAQATTIDTTVTQTIDITAQWGTANAANQLITFSVFISRER